MNHGSKIAGRVLAFFLVASCATGQSAPPEPDPTQARDRWIGALSSGDSARVWAMMAPEARSRFASMSDFDSWCRRYCSDLLVTVMAATDDPEVRARVGGHSTLELEGEDWRVADSTIAPLDRSASAALSRLARRLEDFARAPESSADYGVRLRRFASGLRQLASTPRDEASVGDAPIRVPGGGSVSLSRDDGWAIADWDLPPVSAP